MAAARMKIFPYRQKMHMDKNTAQTTLNQLVESFEQIYKQNSSELYYEQMYRLSYNMTLLKHGDMLYIGVCDMFQSQTNDTLQSLISNPDETLLSATLTAWRSHRTAIEMIKNVVGYLDKVHVTSKKLIPV